MNDIQTRKQIRLSENNYCQNGAYFITICTKNKNDILGVVKKDNVFCDAYVLLSEFGEIVKMLIENISNSKHDVDVLQYVIMPNHVHIIFYIDNKKIDGTLKAASSTIPKIVNSIKGLSSKKAGFSLWQRSYYDHIIRDEADYRIRAQYIEQNPIKWMDDEYYIQKT